MKADILITGVAGFIGSNLCVRLLNEGFSVIGIDDFSVGKKETIELYLKNDRFRFIQGDAGKPDLYVELNVKTVVHLASQKIPRYSSGWKTLTENARLTNTLLDYCISNQARLLFASTSDVYGKNPAVPFSEESDLIPGSPEIARWAYAESKIHAEHLIQAAGREFGLNFQIMRFFGCYGPYQANGWWGGPQSVFIDKAIAGEALTIHGTGEQTRSFIYIDDLVAGIAELIRRTDLKSDTFNLCTTPDSEISIRDLAEKIWKQVRPQETIRLEFIPYQNFGNYEDVIRRTGLSTKAKRAFGFDPKTSLEIGLKKTIEWRTGLD
jgi:UDP-glucose 4-epimerase